MITNYISLVNHENKLVFSIEDPHIRDRMEFLQYPHVVSVWLIVFSELPAISTHQVKNMVRKQSLPFLKSLHFFPVLSPFPDSVILIEWALAVVVVVMMWYAYHSKK